MLELHLRWWVWAALLFVVLMIYKGPSQMATLAGGAFHAVDVAAGDMVKALHTMEHCGSACHTDKPR